MSIGCKRRFFPFFFNKTSRTRREELNFSVTSHTSVSADQTRWPAKVSHEHDRGALPTRQACADSTEMVCIVVPALSFGVRGKVHTKHWWRSLLARVDRETGCDDGVRRSLCLDDSLSMFLD